MPQKDTFPFDQEIVWQPDQKVITASNLQGFMQRHQICRFDDLMQRSVRETEWFWDAVLKDLSIEFYYPYSRVIDTQNGIEFPAWCTGGRMNIVHNCLDKWQADSSADRIALIWEGEEGVSARLSFKDLYHEVNRCANALRGLGLTKGDVIALYMPMTPELLIAFLAIAKMGAIILPLFSGYGAGALETRLTDSGAKALFTTDGAWRRGKIIPLKETADSAVKRAPQIKHMIVHRRTGLDDVPITPGRDHWWNELMSGQSDSSPTEITAAEDEVMLIYTSGTTGKPKGAVHTHCGFPVKAAQDMYHCMDLKAEEIMYWISDMGWMMGPWEVFGTLIIGATMVFYDGAPDFPAPDRLWKQVSGFGITHLGVSPTLIRSLKSGGTDYTREYDLSSLRMIGSTGSPWDPESWMWLFQHVLEGKKPILNYSGGTEISGGIVCGNFFKPLKPCAFSGPVPGMHADVVDEQGKSVRGQVGELVIRSPWIGMTRGFWNDRQRYLDTYWNHWPEMWRHGDFAAIDEDDLWYILGRSDDTIKVAGKRIGPAEVESILNAHPSVTESAVIGIPDPSKGEVIVCFCVLEKNTKCSETLRQELTDRIIRELGKPLKPEEIKFVDKLPKTRNAKVMHRVIRAVYAGREPGDLSNLEDVQAVQAIRSAR